MDSSGERAHDGLVFGIEKGAPKLSKTKPFRKQRELKLNFQEKIR